MSVKDFKSKSSILIEIGKPDDPDDVPKRRKGFVPAGKKKPDFLHRRTSEKGIFFYDLGYLKAAGVFQDFQMIISRSGHPDLFASDYAARDAAIFAIVGGAYKEKGTFISRDICDDTHYRFIVQFTVGPDTFSGNLSELSQFTDEGGLDIPNEAAASLFIFGDAEGIRYGAFSMAPSKITRIYDHSAPAAAFTPSNAMDFYIVPNFITASGHGEFGANFLIYPRSFFLENEPPLVYDTRSPAPAVEGSFALLAIVKQKGSLFYFWQDF